MKLDVTCMRYLSKDDYRVMTALEAGMRNHELVSEPLISSLAKLKHGGLSRILSVLLRYKLVAHQNLEYNGYRLSYLGYDILALHTLCSRGTIASVGSQIGVGKESDIFEAQDADGNEVVVKIHRLGRTSFRAVRRSRDYTQGRSKCSWLFLSRLAASKEYAFMSALHAHGFPTPQPLDHSRHVVAMSRIHGNPISQIRSGRLEDPKPVFLQCIAIISRLASHGLIHCDFNEFNLMLDESNMIILIDFPQMVSFEHPNAEELFERDLNGLVKFFATKMRYTAAIEVIPSFSGVIASTQLSSDFNAFLNGVLEQSGFSKEDNDSLGKYLNAVHNSEIIGEGEDGGIEADGEEVESVSRHSYCADLGIADAHLKENLPVEDAEEAEIEGDNTDDDIEVSGDDVSIAVAGIEKLLTDSRSIKERVQKGRLGPCHTGTSKSSRNSTKKRNKYGRVVKTSIEF